MSCTRPHGRRGLWYHRAEMERLIGQTRAVQLLQTGLSSGKLHHAFIFHGPPGVGKCTCALELGRLLLCHQRQTDLAGQLTACGSCESCRLLRDSDPEGRVGNHPDLHVIRKEMAQTAQTATLRTRKQLNIPVDLLRELMVGGTTSDGRYHEAAAYRTPALRRGKVFIIDEAELLDPHGQNALLKTLEEPTEGTYTILVTSAEHRLLVTIRSRCQRIAFVPLTEDEISQWAGRHLPESSGEQRAWTLAFAEGSPGRALTASRYDLYAWARNVLPQLDQMPQGRFPEDLGATLAELIDEFARAVVKEQPNASKDAANRRGAALMWRVLAQHARGRIAELAGGEAGADPARLEPLVTPWLGLLEAVNEAEGELAANVNLGLVADHLVSRIWHGLGSAADEGASAGRTRAR